MDRPDTHKPQSQPGGEEDLPTDKAVAPRRREVAMALLLVAAGGVLFAVPTFPEPFGVDQGIYGYIAERLLEGAVDHRDVFDHKPPGIHFAYALAFAVFGHAMWSVWLLDLIAVILTAWGLYVLGRQWVGSRMGLIAGLLYVAYYQAFLDAMSRAQPETWLNLAFVAALALIAGAPGRVKLFAAGVALGVGAWFKPTIVLPAILCPVVLGERALRESGGGWRRFGLDLAIVIGGAVVVSGLVLLYYIAHGALRDLYEAVWIFNTRYHGQPSLFDEWRNVWRAFQFILQPVYAPALLAAAAAVSVPLHREKRPTLFAFAWLVLAFATIFWQGSTQKAHYALVLAPMMFLAALGIDGALRFAAARAGKEANQRAVLMAVGGLIFCLVLLNLNGCLKDRVVKLTAYSAGRLSREAYYSSFSLKKGGYSFEDVRQIALYIEKQTTPDDPIYVWGFRPLIAYLAHRRMPTRFCFRYPLTRTQFPHWWNEFLSDLDRSPPVYFVIVTADRHRYHDDGTSKQALENNYALKRYLDDHYEFDRKVSDFEIYRLRRAGDADRSGRGSPDSSD